MTTIQEVREVLLDNGFIPTDPGNPEGFEVWDVNGVTFVTWNPGPFGDRVWQKKLANWLMARRLVRAGYDVTFDGPKFEVHGSIGFEMHRVMERFNRDESRVK